MSAIQIGFASFYAGREMNVNIGGYGVGGGGREREGAKRDRD